MCVTAEEMIFEGPEYVRSRFYAEELRKKRTQRGTQQLEEDEEIGSILRGVRVACAR